MANYFSIGFVKCCAALLVGSTGDVIKEGFRTLPILFDETARLLNDMDQVVFAAMLQVDKLACELSTAPLALFRVSAYTRFFIASGRLDSRPVILSAFAENIFYMYVYGRSYGTFLLVRAPRD